MYSYIVILIASIVIGQDQVNREAFSTINTKKENKIKDNYDILKQTIVLSQKYKDTEDSIKKNLIRKDLINYIYNLEEKEIESVIESVNNIHQYKLPDIPNMLPSLGVVPSTRSWIQAQIPGYGIIWVWGWKSNNGLIGCIIEEQYPQTQLILKNNKGLKWQP
jgi:hypothetical protein